MLLGPTTWDVRQRAISGIPFPRATIEATPTAIRQEELPVPKSSRTRTLGDAARRTTILAAPTTHATARRGLGPALRRT